MNATSNLYASMVSDGYTDYLYNSVSLLPIPESETDKIKQNCLAYCLTETSDECDFVVVNGTVCYLGKVEVGGPWINPAGPITSDLEVIFSPGIL